ncbi:MAG: sigma-54-dependent Fis family transcriptional regulator, partial [Hyphomicrobiales bacterium]
LLDVIQKDHPELPVVIISGHGNIETAVSAIKRGAYDFIEKPFNSDRLLLIVNRALEASRLKRENRELRRLGGQKFDMVGSSQAINQLRNQLRKIAPTNSRVLITGAAGSGKELAARNLHMLSPRANAPFVAINAATITPERMEIELFGMEEGPAGGDRKIGALEEAHGGMLFIDEVADMPMETQGKILRVLVEQTFERVGGNQKVKVDVRIVSSTNRNLLKAIEEGTFREDLYHRLSVIPLHVPPLAERRDDVPELVHYFIEQFSESSGLPVREISDEALAVLQGNDWPGNARQLRNNVERLMILVSDDDGIITPDMLPEEVSESSIPSVMRSDGEHLVALPLREAREVFEREYLLAQISRFGGNVSRTASFIGMERSALHRKLKSLGLNAKDPA